ncbi:MAG TPA: hypothetical protein PLL78_05275 [Fimbriimonadaceae bacterium]|nr:hypothetical protein [Fimbriimonadaceae bacterium]HRJ96077.1 hypothetical protein [Fimbriimonadaceae bacterium]
MPFIHTPEHVAWKAAFENYYWDRLEESWELVEESGVGELSYLLGAYRLIEGEYRTRVHSEISPILPWLQFERVLDETGGEDARLGAEIVAACDYAAERLAWTHDAATMVSILAGEVDRPWATNPYGYCVDKHPYDKICLPSHLISDPRQFFEATAHEYAHVISLNLSQGRAPRWLGEAISVLVERPLDRYALRQFRSGRWAWRAPEDLEGMFDVNSDDRDGVYRAYQQAGLIGRYLAESGDSAKLRQLLVEHAREGLWPSLRRSIAGRSRTDNALRAVYGLGEAELFQKALAGLSEF